MLKTSKRCDVCSLVTDHRNDVLLNKIANSAHFMKGGQSLKDLQAEYADRFSYRSLLNHVKKHQFLSDDDFTKRHLNQIVKKAEAQVLRRNIESKEVWDEVITKGMEKLQNGEMFMKTADLLKAAKDKSDFNLKSKDQQLAMMDMVWHFTSGENNREDRKPYDSRIVEGTAVTDFDPAAEPAGDTERRADESRSFYQSLAGDAPSPGTN